MATVLDRQLAVARLFASFCHCMEAKPLHAETCSDCAHAARVQALKDAGWQYA